MLKRKKVKSFLVLIGIIGAFFLVTLIPRINDKFGGDVRADIPRVVDSKDPDYLYEYETQSFKMYAGEDNSKPKVEIRQGNRVLEMTVNTKNSVSSVTSTPTPTLTPEPTGTITPEPTEGLSPVPTEGPSATPEIISSNLFSFEVKAQENLTLMNTDTESYLEYANDSFILKPENAGATLEFEVEDRDSLPTVSISPMGLTGYKLGSEIVYGTKTNRKAYSFSQATVVDSNDESSLVQITLAKSPDSTEFDPIEIIGFEIDESWLNSSERVFPLHLKVVLNSLFDKKMIPMSPIKSTFSGLENPQFEIDTLFLNDLELQSKLINGDLKDIRFGIIDTRGETQQVAAKVVGILPEDKVLIELDSGKSIVKAGLFDLLLQYKDRHALIGETEFAWGVLAINPDQSVYKTGSIANFDFAVLNKHGMMVCDADLSLTITEPDGSQVFYSTDSGNIVVTEGCKQRITDLPDFMATYQVKGEGEYNLNLISETPDGVFSINDKFKVDNNSPFYVKRKSHTRIFPWITYGMEIEVIKGTAGGNVFVSEKMDKDFIITSTNGEEQPVVGELKEIVWNLDFSTQSSYTLGYRYDAPDKSPAMLLMGPVTVTDKLSGNDKKEIFTEERSWQIAVDAVDVVTSGTTYNVSGSWNDSNNTIEVIGGGGAGVTGTTTGIASGAGGGGGAYGKSVNINLPEGTTVSVQVGSGGATSGANGGNTIVCNDNATCTNYTGANVVASAKGGNGGSGTTAGAGGDTSGRVFNNTTENGSGTAENTGGQGGAGRSAANNFSGGGGGGGAGGPNGNGAQGGANTGTDPGGGGGGGGNGGGTGGAITLTSAGGAGGNNSGATGGGSGGSGGASCTDGNVATASSNGGGGGGGGGTSGAGTACEGGNGSRGTEWTGAGSGGGGGGGGGNTRTSSTGNDGGNGGSGIANTGAGGGGGGSCEDTSSVGGTFGAGGSGVIVITYTPTGPATADVMRHGNWFSSGTEQGFYWVN